MPPYIPGTVRNGLVYMSPRIAASVSLCAGVRTIERSPVHINIWDFPGTLEVLLRPPFSPGLPGISSDVRRKKLQNNSSVREIHSGMFPMTPTHSPRTAVKLSGDDIFRLAVGDLSPRAWDSAMRS